MKNVVTLSDCRTELRNYYLKYNEMAKNEEHYLQVSMINWFRFQYPKLKLSLFAVPNGGHRHIATAKKLKAEGVISGVSDLIFFHQSKAYFIEVKTLKGKQQASQKDFQKHIEKQGAKYYVVRSLDEFIDVIQSIMV